MRLYQHSNFGNEGVRWTAVTICHIISYIGGGDEVSFADYQTPEKRVKQTGFRKTQLVCQKAREDHLEWAWIDTCCIDKSNSAELSEAINSMFKWYEGSAVCYANLNEWPRESETKDSNKALSEIFFRDYRWFSRGWTLQELIAPRNLRFYIDESSLGLHSPMYQSGWFLLGDKSQLSSIFEEVTRIPQPVLCYRCFGSYGIVKRMSWTAGRKTTREEDIAYCLMGLFDINMPMLYGEGKKVFIRLQEEILKQHDDRSLFSWKASKADNEPLRGILARSADEFAESSSIVPLSGHEASDFPATLTSKGISLTGFDRHVYHIVDPYYTGKNESKFILQP
ncbi:HET-domain-containing protein [Biscogniauxia mediterranea]|nr:HET-domain-containing protein [Biscogniauxia mediterranea]